MTYPDLLIFWAVSITWSAAFLTVVSTYLYFDSRKRRMKNGQAVASPVRLVRDFVFVWVLLGLLALYVVSIDRGSAMLFAIGNVVVETILVAYTARNRSKQSEQAILEHTAKDGFA